MAYIERFRLADFSRTPPPLGRRRFSPDPGVYILYIIPAVLYRCVAVADQSRAAVPQSEGRVDVSDNGRQSHRVSARLVEMLRQQLSPVGRRVHVVFHQCTR